MTNLVNHPAYAPLIDTVNHVDLLTLCDLLPAASVDCILADLPYGTTACSWDTIIPLEPMWAAFKRIIKPRGAIVLTASQPFTSVLVSSNLPMFRYEWVWHKNMGSNFAVTDYQPMKEHESVLVFSIGTHNYYPQVIPRSPEGIARSKYPVNPSNRGKRQAMNGFVEKYARIMTPDVRVPSSILVFNVERGYHPTQKPVALFEYLIRTYTQPGDLVLDPTCGSGTTAVAARNTQRHFICGDTDAGYVALANDRLRTSILQPRQVVKESDLSGLPLFAVG